jgi:transcriptional regulator with XRE-family HTH domain/DNA-directed RNA polymerase subunit RPC12/RpoP
MDLKKTGQFIAERRKEKNLTQAKLAEILFISEKTISKWETGKGFPDTSLILPLCEALDISANELLSAKLLDEKEYKAKAEENLVLLSTTEQKYAKFLIRVEMAITSIVLIMFLGYMALASMHPTLEDSIRYLLIGGGFVCLLSACFIALRIEQKAGFYECKHCGHRHVPKYWQVFWAVHNGTTRYLKCPNCNKKSWNKKVISKEDK